MEVDPKTEGKRLDEALSRSLGELATLRARMQSRVPDSELRIVDGQRMILEDEEFVGRIRENISEGRSAECALLRVIEELSRSMLSVADDYLRERVTDFRDLGDRVRRNLRAAGKAGD